MSRHLSYARNFNINSKIKSKNKTMKWKMNPQHKEKPERNCESYEVQIN